MSDILQRLAAVIESRKPEAGGDPEKSYVSRLFEKGDDAILKKNRRRSDRDRHGREGRSQRS